MKTDFLNYYDDASCNDNDDIWAYQIVKVVDDDNDGGDDDNLVFSILENIKSHGMKSHKWQWFWISE